MNGSLYSTSYRYEEGEFGRYEGTGRFLAASRETFGWILVVLFHLLTASKYSRYVWRGVCESFLLVDMQGLERKLNARFWDVADLAVTTPFNIWVNDWIIFLREYQMILRGRRECYTISLDLQPWCHLAKLIK